MIAADTSTWVAFLEGESGPDVESLDTGLKDRQVVMIPAVLTELLSDPKLGKEVEELLCGLPLLETEEGFWQRAGKCRAAVLTKRRKARLGDALIAQSCVDAGVSLVTRDRDFWAFAQDAKLRLAVEST